MSNINSSGLSGISKQMTVLAVILVVTIVIVGINIIYTVNNIEQRQIDRAQIGDERTAQREREHALILREQQEIHEKINLLNGTT